MRLIGAGWGRTGNGSVAAALERLGVGPILTFPALRRDPELAELWHREGIGEPVDWSEALAGYEATLGWPGCWLWPDFAELWPDAVVLLTTRKPTHWYQSLLATTHQATGPGRDVGPPNMAALVERVWTQDFGDYDEVFDEDETIAMFEEHNDEVRTTCPPERLLEWTFTDGWGPLCAALGTAVPDEPFPHLARRPREE